ncbi:tryptophanase [Halorussus caseinilyticus]|uniref:Tryptophanase n=1 Tax=Halorussus caseinilyticus TaxID=3034025 RepID=A0ABD5WI14_9EURY
MGRDDGRRRGLRREREFRPTARGNLGRDGVRAHHPRPSGTRGRERSLRRAGRRRRLRAEQHPLRHDAGAHRQQRGRTGRLPPRGCAGRRPAVRGDLDVEKVRELADEVGAENVPAVLVTITNNSLAGQPVSVENVREARAVADELDATFVVDACRFAENAYFVREREDEFADWSVADIAREQLSYADAIVMSGKKDGLVNVGGFVGIRDDPELDDLYAKTRERGILYEGFTTYGGMAGRDLEAMAVGLREAVEESYVADRVGQVQRLGDLLADRDVPVERPTGGHAVYVNAAEFLPEIPTEQFPGQALVCELYREGAVRGVELGSFAFPETDRPELVRLSLPRRTYGADHLEHVAETFERVAERRDAGEISGLEIVDEPEMAELRHFSAELRPVREREATTADD